MPTLQDLLRISREWGDEGRGVEIWLAFSLADVVAVVEWFVVDIADLYSRL